MAVGICYSRSAWRSAMNVVQSFRAKRSTASPGRVESRSATPTALGSWATSTQVPLSQCWLLSQRSDESVELSTVSFRQGTVGCWSPSTQPDPCPESGAGCVRLSAGWSAGCLSVDGRTHLGGLRLDESGGRFRGHGLVPDPLENASVSPEPLGYVGYVVR